MTAPEENDVSGIPEDRAGAATPPAELERQMMSWSVPKNEREWWARGEIERLRSLQAKDQSAAQCAICGSFHHTGLHTADPPASDGLVADLDAAIERWYDGHSQSNAVDAIMVLQRARDRIAEDAERARYDQEEYDRDTTALEDQLAAAEARAQAEAAALRQLLRERDEAWLELFDICTRSHEGLSLPLEHATQEELSRWTDAITTIIHNLSLAEQVIRASWKINRPPSRPSRRNDG